MSWKENRRMEWEGSVEEAVAQSEPLIKGDAEKYANFFSLTDIMAFW